MVGVSKGLGRRQREILAKLADHRDNPPDYNGWWLRQRVIRLDRREGAPAQLAWEPLDPPVYREKPKWMHDQNPDWMTVRELAGLAVSDLHSWHSSDVEATRRAVRKLEAAGLVETKMIWRNEKGQCQIGVRLTRDCRGL
jgi:hypothetical protein